MQLKNITTGVMFFEPGKIVIGLDIGSVSVKAACIKHTPVGNKILGLGLAYRQANAAADSEAKKTSIAAAIDAALRAVPSSRAPLTVIVHQAPTLTLKHITLPEMPAAELAEAVKWELAQHLPFTVEQGEIAYVSSGQTIRNGTKQLELETVSIAHTDVIHYLDEIGLRSRPLRSLTVAPFCLWNVFQKNQRWTEDQAVAIVDIGALTTKIMIYHHHALRFCREAFWGGVAMTDALAAAAGITPAEAEQIKIHYGLEPACQWHEAIKESAQDLTSEIERSFGYYKTQSRLERIDRVLLCGGGAGLKQLEQVLSERLGIVCEIGDPLGGLAMPAAAPPDTVKNKLLFTAAIGAALEQGETKSINLLPMNLRHKATAMSRRHVITAAIVLLIVLAGGLYGSLRLSISRQQKELAAGERINQAWNEQQTVRRALDFFKQAESERQALESIMQGISSAIPVDVVLDSVEVTTERKTVVLSGEAREHVLAVRFVGSLQQLAAIRQATLQSLERTSTTAALKFRIVCQLR